MGKGIPFVISVWPDVHVHEAVPDIEWNDMVIRGDDALETASLEGLIEDLVLEGLKLTRGVDGVA